MNGLVKERCKAFMEAVLNDNFDVDILFHWNVKSSATFTTIPSC